MALWGSYEAGWGGVDGWERFLTCETNLVEREETAGPLRLLVSC